MLLFYGIAAIAVSCILMYVAAGWLVVGLLQLSRFFRMTEFVVAFFVMSFAATLPNLFVGVTSALQGMPELSFGDIMGNNIIALTVAVALGIFFAPRKELSLESDTVRDTAFLTSVAAILPLILISDGLISRSDGLVLVLFFVGYSYWLFLKQDLFTRVFQEDEEEVSRAEILTSIGKVVIGIVLLALAAQGIVYGASLLGAAIDLSLVLIGVLLLGIGGALPEIYFSVVSARRGETDLIVSNLMGAVIVQATLFLGLVSFLAPIHNDELVFPLVNRVFLVGIALYFLYISQSRQAIGLREAYTLLCLYALFVASLFLL